MKKEDPLHSQDEDLDPYLDDIVWAAYEDGLEGLTVEQRDYLETYLWESGGEEFDNFYYDKATPPIFGKDHIWMIEADIDQKRLVELQAGSPFTENEEHMLREAWSKNLEENPDDDITPGVWTDTVYASDGTGILTVRHCHGAGWDADRTLVEIKPL